MSSPQKRGLAVRDKILNTADELFYREGIRAIGVDTIVEKSGVAKTSLYRWFPTKDDLIAAFLRRRDSLFWEQWDKTAEKHQGDPTAELLAQLRWISQYVASPAYRGCPFQIAATEFPDLGHASRAICIGNKQELRRRLLELVRKIGVAEPGTIADQLLLLIDGAFINTLLFAKSGPAKHLVKAGAHLIGASA
ncbi:TetR/AcrR family transcriptional regulator [Bradyrhizobium neotropicale]|uniref:TetR/AcrR family transcriptional regulator n=1 Tax=Bradyrhizobium neotropicale TaxID=1497615 RepID=UPI001AD69FF7|nr:TetR/AcrR family transcriptional regulator [Bradyrhizobium neotropicale]MBO4220854.1 TetR family transcriptional regulator [Bradyrhizobium neotropicale]